MARGTPLFLVIHHRRASGSLFASNSDNVGRNGRAPLGPARNAYFFKTPGHRPRFWFIKLHGETNEAARALRQHHGLTSHRLSFCEWSQA